MRLAIALATRGRPEILRKTLERTLPNLAEADTRIVVIADADDASMAGFHYADPRVIVSIAPREDSLGGKFNRALRIASADVYMVMVDYAPHITAGFDKRIVEAAKLFPDGIGVVYNHMANLSFPLLNAVTGRWAELAGGIYPEYFPYWFVDHWLDDLARMTDRIACADVHVDVAARPGTQDMREPGFWAVFYDSLMLERRRVAEQLIDAMAEPAWRKAVLRSRMHLVDERSRMLNNLVRGFVGTDTTTDERYARIKARALGKLTEIAAQLEAA